MENAGNVETDAQLEHESNNSRAFSVSLVIYYQPDNYRFVALTYAPRDRQKCCHLQIVIIVIAVAIDVVVIKCNIYKPTDFNKKKFLESMTHDISFEQRAHIFSIASHTI